MGRKGFRSGNCRRPGGGRSGISKAINIKGKEGVNLKKSGWAKNKTGCQNSGVLVHGQEKIYARDESRECCKHAKTSQKREQVRV